MAMGVEVRVQRMRMTISGNVLHLTARLYTHPASPYGKPFVTKQKPTFYV